MKNALYWIAAVVLAAAGAAYLYLASRQGEAPPEPIPAARPEIAVEIPEKPEIAHPVEEIIEPPAAETEPEPLPALHDSDGELLERVTALADSDLVTAILRPEAIIPRIVATVDNLPRGKLALKIIPVTLAPGKFRTEGAGDDLAISPDNAARYSKYVALIEAMDTEALVALYRRYYPLFQEAYRDLGYPDAYFNDRLVAVIDHLLATPEIDGPILLYKPEAVYQYSDKDLETLSAGQKILLRMGRENAAIVRQKLSGIRNAVTRGNQS